jgi:hypothetical protein
MSAQKQRELKRFLAQADTDLPWDQQLSLLIMLVALKRFLGETSATVLFGESPDLLPVSDTTLFSLCSRLYEINDRFCSPTVRRAVPPPVESSNISAIWTAIPEFARTDATVLGDLYQLMNLPARRDAQGEVETADKTLAPSTLIAFTQLYTPDWVVQKLVDHCLEPYGEHARAAFPPAFRLLDPACGAGHFLLYAFDEITARLVTQGLSAQEAATRVAREYLFGTDIDKVAVWIASLAMLIKLADQGVVPDFICANLSAVEPGNKLLGSLEPAWPADHPLGLNYDVIVSNPPYIGRKLIDRGLKAALKTLYPDASYDLCAAFVCRSLSMLKPHGRIGFIAQSSLLHLPTYKQLRDKLTNENTLLSAVELGTGVFPLNSGEKINSCLLVAESGKRSQATADFSATKYATISINSSIALSKVAEIRQGLATTNNALFVRNWWDVDPSTINTRWFPYAKSGGSDRWFTPVRHVVDWENNGERIKNRVAEAYPYLKGKTAWVVKNEQFYFRPGLSFSFVNSRRLAVRVLPAGSIFDVACSAIFPANQEQTAYLHAYLNSTPATLLAKQINPTINFQVGDVKQIPVPDFTSQERERLSELAAQAEYAKRELCALDITSLNWQPPQDFIRELKGPEVRTSLSRFRDRLVHAHARLEQAESSIDELVSHLVPVENHTFVPSKGPQLPSDTDLEFTAIFYALQTELTEPAFLDSLDLPLTKHLCAQFSMNPKVYLTIPFLNHQLAKLRKSPCFFTIECADRKVILSQQHIRSLHGLVPPEISGSLSSIPDWTGKDVHQLILQSGH